MSIQKTLEDETLVNPEITHTDNYDKWDESVTAKKKEARVPFSAIVKKGREYNDKVHKLAKDRKWNLEDSMMFNYVVGGHCSKGNMMGKKMYNSLMKETQCEITRTYMEEVPYAAFKDGYWSRAAPPILGDVVFIDKKGSLTWSQIQAELEIKPADVSNVGTYATFAYSLWRLGINCYENKGTIKEKGTKGETAPVSSATSVHQRNNGLPSWVKHSISSPVNPLFWRALLLMRLIAKEDKGLESAKEELGRQSTAILNYIKDARNHTKKLEVFMREVEKAAADAEDPLFTTFPSVAPPGSVIFTDDGEIDYPATIHEISAYSEISMRDTFGIIGCLGMIGADCQLIRACIPSIVRSVKISEYWNEQTKDMDEQTKAEWRPNHSNISGCEIVALPCLFNVQADECGRYAQRFGTFHGEIKPTTITLMDAIKIGFRRDEVPDQTRKRTILEADAVDVPLVMWRKKPPGEDDEMDQDGSPKKVELEGILATAHMTYYTEPWFLGTLTQDENQARKGNAVANKKRSMANVERLKRKIADDKLGWAQRVAKMKFYVTDKKCVTFARMSMNASTMSETQLSNWLTTQSEKDKAVFESYLCIPAMVPQEKEAAKIFKDKLKEMQSLISLAQSHNVLDKEKKLNPLKQGVVPRVVFT